jgi:hypothetical protein
VKRLRQATLPGYDFATDGKQESAMRRTMDPIADVMSTPGAPATASASGLLNVNASTTPNVTMS